MVLLTGLGPADERQRALAGTVLAHLDDGLRPERTADLLHVHPNTVSTGCAASTS